MSSIVFVAAVRACFQPTAFRTCVRRTNGGTSASCSSARSLDFSRRLFFGPSMAYRHIELVGYPICSSSATLSRTCNDQCLHNTQRRYVVHNVVRQLGWHQLPHFCFYRGSAVTVSPYLLPWWAIYRTFSYRGQLFTVPYRTVTYRTVTYRAVQSIYRGRPLPHCKVPVISRSGTVPCITALLPLFANTYRQR